MSCRGNFGKLGAPGKVHHCSMYCLFMFRDLALLCQTASISVTQQVCQ